MAARAHRLAPGRLARVLRLRPLARPGPHSDEASAVHALEELSASRDRLPHDGAVGSQHHFHELGAGGDEVRGMDGGDPHAAAHAVPAPQCLDDLVAGHGEQQDVPGLGDLFRRHGEDLRDALLLQEPGVHLRLEAGQDQAARVEADLVDLVDLEGGVPVGDGDGTFARALPLVEIRVRCRADTLRLGLVRGGVERPADLQEAGRGHLARHQQVQHALADEAGVRGYLERRHEVVSLLAQLPEEPAFVLGQKPIRDEDHDRDNHRANGKAHVPRLQEPERRLLPLRQEVVHLEVGARTNHR
mmetsp:Transcript_26295/g.66608  ORF Transcript_26295/g.66608 Transcript_26295/m.66608 type:complete len:301 (-) Transcript_26295:3-905(-)